jgi:hypothetical protein
MSRPKGVQLRGNKGKLLGQKPPLKLKEIFDGRLPATRGRSANCSANRATQSLTDFRFAGRRDQEIRYQIVASRYIATDSGF